MLTQEQQKYKKTLSLIAGVMLLLAIPSIWPYGYFQILRWVIAGAAGFNTYIAYQLNRKIWLWIMVTMVIVFNPIAPIHLTKEVWSVLDVVAAILMFTSIGKLRNSE